MRCLSRSRRRTMLAPIRPSPMKPRSIASGLPEGRGKGSLEDGEAGVRVGPEVDANDRQLVVLDRSGVADRLGIDELAEAVRLAGDVSIVGMLGDELQEPADRGAALVELPRRMQEAGSESDGRGPAGPIAE